MISNVVRKCRTLFRLGRGALLYPSAVKKFQLPRILSIQESIDRMQRENLSIARFGDSEYMYLTGNSDGLQKTSSALKEGLKRALLNRNPKLMVCLVNYEDLSDRTLRARFSAMMFHQKTIQRYIGFLSSDYVYGNSNMTRFYMGQKKKWHSGELFEQFRSIWNNKDVVIFEGENTRFGYGNNLLSNTTSIKRVLCPSKEAFDVYDEIIEKARTVDKKALLLFALGATATVAASDLTDDGYVVIDIGNLDIEYEWYLRGYTRVTKIDGKQVSEARGGMAVGALNDENYRSQIIGFIAS
jgi:glycosyltransferase family protein